MRKEKTGHKIGDIEQVELFCDDCVGGRLEKVHCEVSAFGAIFTMSRGRDDLAMLICPICNRLYAYQSMEVANG